MTLQDPLRIVKGIGDKRVEILKQAGFAVVGDLLSYIPFTYEDSTNILTFAELFDKIRDTPIWEAPREFYTVKGTVEKIMSLRTRRGFIIVTATISDSSFDRKIKAIWFNQTYIASQIQEGSNYVFYGRVKIDKGTLVLQSPQYEEIIDGLELKKLGRVLPIYRRVKTITAGYFRQYISKALKDVTVDEYLSEDMLANLQMPAIEEAYSDIHVPKVLSDAEKGYKRLAVQELLELRDEYEQLFASNKVEEDGAVGKKLAQDIGSWIPKLPYKLTKGQESVLQTLVEDIAAGKVVDTFLYGDVGSGKTIIALLMAFGFLSQGKNAVLIAPTTILSSQHIRTAQKLVELLGLPFQNQIVEVNSKSSAKVDMKSGEPTLYIGTQAILHKSELLEDEKVSFVCIDEQHRFGVDQRMALKRHKRHVLTLSATPIPRTLALSFLGFSQALFLDEKPVGRLSVITKLVPFGKEEVTYQWIAGHVEKGEQAYIVFPRVESETENEKQSLLATADVLKDMYFFNYRCAVLYGGMKEAEKEEIMKDFAAGKIQILFSTSVIEVGVDVGNATIIAIHDAELFGLAQLHQLRGRVGRSDKQSYCFLFTEQQEQNILDRLEYFSSQDSGIAVAEYDLSHRGTGTLLGTLQAGLSELRIASLQDLSLIKDAMDLYKRLKEQNIAIPRYIRVKSTNEE